MNNLRSEMYYLWSYEEFRAATCPPDQAYWFPWAYPWTRLGRRQMGSLRMMDDILHKMSSDVVSVIEVRCELSGNVL